MYWKVFEKKSFISPFCEAIKGIIQNQSEAFLWIDISKLNSSLFTTTWMTNDRNVKFIAFMFSFCLFLTHLFFFSEQSFWVFSISRIKFYWNATNVRKEKKRVRERGESEWQILLFQIFIHRKRVVIHLNTWHVFEKEEEELA